MKSFSELKEQIELKLKDVLEKPVDSEQKNSVSMVEGFVMAPAIEKIGDKIERFFPLIALVSDQTGIITFVSLKSIITDFDQEKPAVIEGEIVG